MAAEPFHVPVPCTANYPSGAPCRRDRDEHVHRPIPCENGSDERHHDFAPPRSVLLEVAGRRRRVRVAA